MTKASRRPRVRAMNSVSDLVRRTAGRLGEQGGGIETALEQVAETAEATTDLTEAAAGARRMVLDRIDALEKAQAELQELLAKLEHLQAILAYTQEGWPDERARLRSLARTNPVAGIAAWLRYWYGAAESHRLDALDRLVREVRLPAGAELIAERGATAAAGLRDRDWSLAAPMLAAGAARIRVGDHEVPDPEVQASLQLLLARLALANGKLQEAGEILGEARTGPDNAAVLALRARRHRLAGNPGPAEKLLEKAHEANPGDLDVVDELVSRASEGEQVDIAMAAAKVGVDALSSLLDVDSDLGRLLEPPAELWLAVADRARRDGFPELAEHALDEAEKLVSWRGELSAVVAERKAEVAQPGEPRLRAMLLAGDRRASAGHVERARINYEKVLDEGDEGEPRLKALAAMRASDCVAVIAANQPLRVVGGEVADALDRLVRARAIEGLAVSESECYLTEVELRLNLARTLSPERADQFWRAFLAAARAVALGPTEARRWNAFATAVQQLSCYRAAEAATSHARDLSAKAEIAVRAEALANVGRYQDALGLLAGATDPWSECARGYLLLRVGEPDRVVRLLRAVTIDPGWTWAHRTLLSALVLTGCADDAAKRAEALAANLADPIDEHDVLAFATELELFQGHFARAAELAARSLDVQTELDNGDAVSALGRALLLSGERDRGLELLKKGASAYTTLGLLDWISVERPQVEALARWGGVEIGRLSGLDPHVERRRRELERLSDPVAELGHAAGATAEPTVVAQARALGTALLHLARGEVMRVDEALAEVGADLAEEVRTVRGHLRDLTDTRRREAMAAEVLELSSAGNRAGAKAVLTRLLDEVPDHVVGLLERQASGDGLRRAGRLLAELARDPRYEQPASDALQRLGLGQGHVAGSSLEPSALQVKLPGSWFRGHPDPVRDHPLFVRYLPELRQRLSWELPPVRVSVDAALEPDGYRILADGQLLDEGHVDPTARYCREGATALLPSDLRSRAERDPELGYQRIPGGVNMKIDVLAELLTMTPPEVVTRLIGDAASVSSGGG